MPQKGELDVSIRRDDFTVNNDVKPFRKVLVKPRALAALVITLTILWSYVPFSRPSSDFLKDHENIIAGNNESSGFDWSSVSYLYAGPIWCTVCLTNPGNAITKPGVYTLLRHISMCTPRSTIGLEFHRERWRTQSSTCYYQEAGCCRR